MQAEIRIRVRAFYTLRIYNSVWNVILFDDFTVAVSYDHISDKVAVYPAFQGCYTFSCRRIATNYNLLGSLCYLFPVEIAGCV